MTRHDAHRVPVSRGASPASGGGCVLRWVFLTAPARAYRRGEAKGGSVPWPNLVAMITGALLGGMVRAGFGWLHADVRDSLGVGIAMGLLLAVAWFIDGIALVGVR